MNNGVNLKCTFCSNAMYSISTSAKEELFEEFIIRATKAGWAVLNGSICPTCSGSRKVLSKEA